jgi:hypothetical protein
MAKESQPNPTEDILAITEAFNVASVHGLEVEVLASAFKAQRENPQLTLQESLQVGLGDWDLL